MTARRAVAGAVIAVALVLAVLAGPRFIGAVAALPANYAINELNEGRVPSAEVLRRAIEALDSALDIDAVSPDYRFNVALARLALAEKAETEAAERDALNNRALDDVVAGLRLRPADSGGWARLALARIRAGASVADIEAALAMSLQTSPYDRNLMLFRMDVALSYWKELSGQSRSDALRQIRGLWTWMRDRYDYPREWREFKRIVCAHRAQPVLAEALVSDPAALAIFEEKSNEYFSAKPCAEALAAAQP